MAYNSKDCRDQDPAKVNREIGVHKGDGYEAGGNPPGVKGGKAQPSKYNK